MYMVPNTCTPSKVYEDSMRITLELHISKKALSSAQAKYTTPELTKMITTELGRTNTMGNQFSFGGLTVPP
ncbi:hypothetical protein PHET_00448 [Paragonimus heterotremus]|uniref:Uncharacterized protein n=1 Tax=Paragonimus heterotremus TaxID=100268 RepID=A0A8J4WJX3_9TREM|nr:hypothetical protein PHET_00448 [Paragonimus heterotremus]